MQEKHFMIQFLKQIDKLEKHIIYHVSKRVESDDITLYTFKSTKSFLQDFWVTISCQDVMIVTNQNNCFFNVVSDVTEIEETCKSIYAIQHLKFNSILNKIKTAFPYTQITELPHVDDIRWQNIFTEVSFTIDELTLLVKEYSFPKIVWDIISDFQVLNEDFIRNHFITLNCVNIVLSGTTSATEILKISDKINWKNITQEFLHNSNEFDWDFIETYKQYWDWDLISKEYPINMDFLTKFIDYIDVETMILYNKNLDERFIQVFNKIQASNYNRNNIILIK